jgi:8-hydroxy-5-deazaflavin:NADPH oxidoreductase
LTVILTTSAVPWRDILVRGNERVVLAAEDQSHARQLATELGPLAMVAPVRDAVSEADTVVIAVWLDGLKYSPRD